MCGICGCGDGEARVEDASIGGPSGRPHDHGHHHHGHRHGHPADDLRFEPGRTAGAADRHLLAIEQDILAKNRGFAEANRARLLELGVLALNLVSSPGAGKTTLLARTIEALRGRTSVAVIEGDQETSNDARRIRAAGAAAVQINTGRGCHLDAHMVGHALDRLALEAGGILFIENVGNLVCPAAFDLGEARRVVILSVTEGEDKPIKYPDIFAAADLMLLSKTDLLPHVDFDVARCIAHARCVNPEIEVLQVSARSGAGLAEWIAWIEGSRGAALQSCAARPGRRLAGIAACTKPISREA